MRKHKQDTITLQQLPSAARGECGQTTSATSASAALRRRPDAVPIQSVSEASTSKACAPSTE